VCGINRLLDFCNTGTQWKIDVPTINHSFVRFALPIVWDFAEGNPVGDMAGSYRVCQERVIIGLENILNWDMSRGFPNIACVSAIKNGGKFYDAIITDPPYYDAIPYSDLMDFFYVWLRRTLTGSGDHYDAVFAGPCAPKWDREAQDGELIDDSSRFNGRAEESRRNYEDGMFRAFQACRSSLSEYGRLVVAFAHKQPDAWESLSAAIIYHESRPNDRG